MASKFASFPFPLGVGTDICRIQRIRRILDKRAGAKFITRILTEEERTAADRIIGPILAEQTTSPDAVSPGGEDQVASAANKSAARFLAGRFAAKEAVFKAASEKIGFQDVIVRRKPSGQPFAVLKGDGTRQDREALLSISHDGDYATAVAIVALDEAWPRAG